MKIIFPQKKKKTFAIVTKRNHKSVGFTKRFFFINNSGKLIFVREMCVSEWMEVVQASQTK